MAEKTATSLTIESSSTPSIAQADVVSQNSSSNSELVNEVFSLFKGYLISQLQEKGKQFERSAKSDKEAADIKYKANRKQFEVNARLDNILTQIDESTGSPADIHKLVASQQCDLGSIPRSDFICGLSLLVLYSALRGFLPVLQFPISSTASIWLDLC